MGGRAVAVARMCVGPLALAGFFLPWAHGPGPLAATQFTGYQLVGYAGRLQALDLSLAAGGGLWLARLVVLGVAVAGVWQLVLAPAHRWHPLYAFSGWYLVAMAVVALGLGVARAGVVVPPWGLALLAAAGVVFAAGEAWRLVAGRRRARKDVPAE